jgi:hypothetical protein
MQARYITRLSFSVTCAAAAIASALFVASSLGCGNQLSGEGFPTCGDDSGVECPQIPCTASKVLYHCELKTFGAATNVGVCLPPDLNLAVASSSQQASINAMCDAGTYDKAVFDYGQQVVTQIVGLAELDNNGKSCSSLGNLLDGGVDDAGHPEAFCNPIDSGVTNIDYCEDAGVYVPVSCCGVPNPDSGLCDNNPCHSFVSAGPSININNCQCNTLPLNPATCDIEGGTVVFPPAGNDPPDATTNGVISHAISAINTATLDSTASYAKAHLHFTDTFNAGHDDTEQSQLSGEASIYGKPSADGSATVLFDGLFTGTDLHFHFSGVDVLGNVDLYLKNISISVGAGTNEISLDSSGNGTIASQTMAVTLRAMVNDQLTIVRRTNDTALTIKVNFAAKTFSIPAFTFSPFGADVTVGLSGTITNQPPTVSSGGNQSVECTSPTGGNVTLNGTATDPDNDIQALGWFEGPPVPQTTFPAFPLFNLNTLVGTSATLTTIAPFAPPSLDTGFMLLAQDHTLQIDFSQAIVTVRDTTAPTLAVAATPSCLWPPNHTMVLYQLGTTLSDSVADICDLHPKVEILSVTSDQAPNGGGSGNAAPDIVEGTQAFCVRAERDGTIASARHYTVVVKATDASGNSTTKNAIITVAHDQAGVACPKIPGSQLVSDDDPRCSAN